MDQDEWQKRESRRNEIIEMAVRMADRVIMDESDGSCEETNFLTAEVARKMMDKALIPFSTAMQKKDLGM